MRLVCSSCDCVYGEGKNKPKFGFCRECWRLHLLRLELNRRSRWAARERERGHVPLLKDLHPAPREKEPSLDEINYWFRDDGEEAVSR